MRRIRKIPKRIEAFILIAMIVFSVLPMVWAEIQPGGMFINTHIDDNKYDTHVDSYAIDERDAQTGQYNGDYSYENFSWTNILNKYAEKIDDDTFKLTLSVKGDKIAPPPTPVVCVLVLDVSNSMNEKGTTGSDLTKIQELRTAVKNFADGFLSASSKNCLALVKYSDYANVLGKSGSNDFYGSKDCNSSALNGAVSKLTAEGGTNTQGGLLKAYTVLSSQKGLGNYLSESEIKKAEYFVILMSDGGANEYYQLGSQENTATASPDASCYTKDKLYTALLNYNTSNADYAIGGEGTQIWTSGGQLAAVNARNLVLGTLQNQSSSISERLPQIPKLYTVGFDVNTELNGYLSDLASDPNYAFSASDGNALVDIYAELSSQINSPTITEGSIITDTLSEYFEFTSDWFIGAKIGVTDYSTPVEARAAVDSETGVLTWSLSQNIGANITASISVKIKAKPNAYSISCDEPVNGKIPTNTDAELVYWNVIKPKSKYIDGNSGTYYSAKFTSPIVHVQKQTLAVDKKVYKNAYEQTNLNGQADSPGNWDKIPANDWENSVVFNSLDKMAIFKITVTNTGKEANGVKLTDAVTYPGGYSLPGHWLGIDPTSSEFSVPEKGQVNFYYVTDVLNKNGSYINTSTIAESANYEGGGYSASSSVLVGEPGISVENTVWNSAVSQYTKSASFNSGDTAVFKVTVSNASSVATNPLSFTDIISGDTLLNSDGEPYTIQLNQDNNNITSVKLNNQNYANFNPSDFVLNPGDMLEIIYNVKLTDGLGNDWEPSESILTEQQQSDLDSLNTQLSSAESELGNENDILDADGHGSLYAILNSSKEAYEAYKSVNNTTTNQSATSEDNNTDTSNTGNISQTDANSALNILQKTYTDAEAAVQSKIDQITQINTKIDNITKLAEEAGKTPPPNKEFTADVKVGDNESSIDIEVKPVQKTDITVEKYVIPPFDSSTSLDSLSSLRQKVLIIDYTGGTVTFEIDIKNAGAEERTVAIQDIFNKYTPVSFRNEDIVGLEKTFNPDGTITLPGGETVTLRYTATIPPNNTNEEKVYQNMTKIIYPDESSENGGNVKISSDTDTVTVIISTAPNIQNAKNAVNIQNIQTDAIAVTATEATATTE
ncbi:MAG: VWA domain-containing protein [Oscillospiraceae bacterium]|nr:VWA domain-containing protein [Oscillospiraceae bacterium]